MLTRTSRRSPARTLFANGLRRAVVAALLFLLLGIADAAAQAPQHDDVRVSALSSAALREAPIPFLVDRNRQHRARALEDYEHAFLLLSIGAATLAFFWFWRTGTAARLRDALRRRFRVPAVQRFVFGATLGALGWLATGPFLFIAYRLQFSADLSSERAPAWLVHELLRLPLIAIVSGVAVAVALELVDRTRLWYLGYTALLFVVVLGVVGTLPALVDPLVTPVGPAPRSIVNVADRYARALDVAPVPLRVERQSTSDAIVTRTAGFGGFASITIGAHAFARLTPGEVRFLLARAYVRIRNHDVLTLALVALSLFVIAAAIAVLVSDRIGFRRDDDPLARLALVGAFLGLATLMLYPLYNGTARFVERRADLAAVAATNDPTSAVRLLVRRGDDDLIPLCGRRSTRWFFDARPPLGTRIATIRHSSDPCGLVTR